MPQINKHTGSNIYWTGAAKVCARIVSENNTPGFIKATIVGLQDLSTQVLVLEARVIWENYVGQVICLNSLKECLSGSRKVGEENFWYLEGADNGKPGNL